MAHLSDGKTEGLAAHKAARAQAARHMMEKEECRCCLGRRIRLALRGS